MRLQPRDEALLKLCYEHRFLVFEHVADHFFKGKTFQRSWKRIHDLEQAKLVRLQCLETLGSKQIIRLTNEGKKLIEETTPLRVKQTGRIQAATFVHDALVTTIRTRLSDFWDGSWIPEGALKAEDFIEVPDGLIVFHGGKRIAIEVERTPKGISRFLGLLDRWKKIDVMMVLYITDSSEMMGYLKKHLPEGPSKVCFGLLDWSLLKVGKPLVWTPAGEMDLLSARSFE